LKKIKKFDKRKPVVLAGLLAVCLGVGIFSQQTIEKNALETDADYVQYEEQKMDLHDGEVLVDSINLTGVPGKSPQEPAVPEGSDKAVSSLLSEDPEVLNPLVSVVTSDELEGLEDPETYFEEVRATMNMDRNKVLDMLSQVIEEAPTDSEKQNAADQKLKLINYMEKEKTMESLIENKGYPEALVIMTDSSVNVTINKQELSQVDAAKISDIVMRETGRSADQIIIQTKK